jgi:hypothetical protein
VRAGRPRSQHLKFGHLRAEPALECGSAGAALVPRACSRRGSSRFHRSAASPLACAKKLASYRSPGRGPSVRGLEFLHLSGWWPHGELAPTPVLYQLYVALRHPQSMKIAWFDRKSFFSSGRFGYFRSRARLQPCRVNALI